MIISPRNVHQYKRITRVRLGQWQSAGPYRKGCDKAHKQRINPDYTNWFLLSNLRVWTQQKSVHYTNWFLLSNPRVWTQQNSARVGLWPHRLGSSESTFWLPVVGTPKANGGPSAWTQTTTWFTITCHRERVLVKCSFLRVS